MKTLQSIQEQSKNGLLSTDSKDQLNQMVLNRSKQAYEKRNRLKRQLNNVEKIHQHQTWFEENLLSALGGIPKSISSLNPQITAIHAYQNYTKENIIFESLEKVYVSANLYKPSFVQKEKYPAILLSCGHQRLGKHSLEYQWVAQTLVSYGFIVFVIDNFGQGERFSYLNNGELEVNGLTFEHDMAGYQSTLLGANIARYMVYDHMRAIDYLVSRNDVDTSKIGITGNSGGGTLSSLLMVLDDRIQAAAPATFITRRDHYQKTGQPQDREQHWFNLSALGFDHEDLLIAFAPKPLHLMLATYDFFPIEGSLESYEIAKQIYQALNSVENLSKSIFEIEHSYPVEMATEAARFFQNVFKLEDHVEVEYIDDPKCICTQSGQISTDFKDARFVYHLNLDHYHQIKKHQSRRSPNRLRNLERYFDKNVYRNRIFQNFNAKRASILDETNEYLLEHWTFNTQIDITNSILWFKQKKSVEETLILVWPKGSSDLASHEDFIHEKLNQGKNLIILDLSGEGYLQQRGLIYWAKSDEAYGSLYKLNDDLLWLGDSLAFLRSYEVLKTIEWLKTLKIENIRLFGFDGHSLYTRIACAMSPHSIDYEEIRPFKGFEDWLNKRNYDESDGRNYAMFGILKIADMNELDCRKKETK